MAIIYYEGFDGLLSTASGVTAYTPPGWSAATNLHSSYGRFGGIGCNGANQPKIRFTATSEIIVGAALYDYGTYGTAGDRYFISIVGETSTLQHVTFRFDSSGAIDVRRGDAAGTRLAISAPGTIQMGQWGYFEAKVTIADSGGTVVVRWNGVEIINFTGDTKNGGTLFTIDSILFNGRDNAFIDDIYVIDTQVAPNQTWLGDVRIVSLLPNGNGTYNQGIGSDSNSVDNYLLVDEVAPSATDYVTIANGNKDSYTFQDLNTAANAVIHAVGVRSFANKTSSGARSIKNFVDLGGTISSGTATPLGSSLYGITSTFLTKPGGGAWTTADVNAVQAGAEAA